MDATSSVLLSVYLEKELAPMGRSRAVRGRTQTVNN